MIPEEEKVRLDSFQITDSSVLKSTVHMLVEAECVVQCDDQVLYRLYYNNT